MQCSKICLPLVMVTSSVAAFAQSSDDSPYSARPLEEVAVISRRVATPVVDLPANVSVLGNQRLRELSAVHIQQALSQIPGVSMQRGNGQESLPAIRSAVQTGAGACGSVLVMEEGIPVRGAGACNVNELFDTHFEQAASLEVVRGANSAFYGSNALNGSVNVVLSPDVSDHVRVELGSHNYRRLGAATSYQTAGDSLGALFLTLTDDGGYRDEAGYDQRKLSWRHQHRLDDWTVNIGATMTRLDQETAGFVIGENSYLDARLARQNLDPEAYRHSRSARAWLGATRQLTTDDEVNATLYIRDTSMEFLQHFLPGDPLEENTQTGFGWQSVWRHQQSASLQWAMGFDGELNALTLTQSQAEPTPGSDFLRETIPTGIHYDYEVDARQLALFGQMEWQLTETLGVVADLRWESMHYDYDNLTLAGRTRDDGSECGFGGCRYSRPADRRDQFQHVSPKLELRYQPDSRWRWSMRLADAFRAPQATELYRLQRAQNVAELDVVNALSTEFAVRYTSDQLVASLVAFDAQFKNLIIRDSDFFNVDGQAVDSHGLELAVQWQINSAWQWSVNGSWATHRYASEQLVGEVNLNGNLVDTAPKQFGSTQLGWSPNTGFSMQVEWQHMGDYFTDPENEHRYPGHNLLHLRSQLKLNETWALSMQLNNVLDKRYAERADFTSFTGDRYFPGQPRSVYFSLEWHH
ncbi:hypothetical protein GCM10008090_15820 [Arenicella chitinivorans]|uniref:TonB-dependent receptor n=1 Tax=Arenicella chitinivorans TaxID=1329800 RepID=A0A918RNM5_9GAMM|nr:TonB-dependent receptor [Arenicella chitinivorans]GHA06962.1 hypothetical protein GCM10008090_15820 [Arenicella chitinivorans]